MSDDNKGRQPIRFENDNKGGPESVQRGDDVQWQKGRMKLPVLSL